MVYFRFEIGQRDTTLDGEVSVVMAQQRLHFVDVVFILNLADDLLENVFQRHEARGAAELIHDDREVAAAALKVAQLAIEAFRLRHEASWPDQTLPCRVRLGAVVQARQHVLRVQHADNRVGVPVEDDQARMFTPPECAHHVQPRCPRRSTAMMSMRLALMTSDTVIDGSAKDAHRHFLRRLPTGVMPRAGAAMVTPVDSRRDVEQRPECGTGAKRYGAQTARGSGANAPRRRGARSPTAHTSRVTSTTRVSAETGK